MINRKGIILKAGDFFIIKSKSGRFTSSFLVLSSDGQEITAYENTFDYKLKFTIAQRTGGAAKFSLWHVDENTEGFADPMLLKLFARM